MSNAPRYYTYLMASLPMLRFGGKAPFSFEALLEKCKDLIPERDIGIVRSLTSAGENPYDKTLPLFNGWRAFDTALRNELVKIRASRKHVDPAPYLRRDGYTDPSIATVAMNAYKNPSMLESEKILDEARWRALDELAIGHYFDPEALIIYAHKLLMLEKWDRIEKVDRKQIIEQVVSK